MNAPKRGLCAAGLAIALCGVPYSIAQRVPEGSMLTVPTNLAHIRAFVRPPATFDPIVAPSEALRQYGFPPRPDQLKAPEAYKAWARAVSAPQKRLESPQLEQTAISNGPARILPSGGSKQATSEFSSAPANAIATNSSNWSGYVDYDNTNLPFADSYIYAYWIVPVAQHAFDTSGGGWDYSSQWVGIDGFGSSDVLQAGTEADAYASGSSTGAYYAAWIEWYPNSESRISNFLVAPGDEMFVQVWNTSPTVGVAYLLNITSQQVVAFTFDAPSGTSLVGNSAEWVLERPGIGDSLATLTNYVACPFDSCYAFGSVNGGTYNATYYPGTNLAGTTVYAISMLDDSGQVISIPSLVGLTDIWFRDTGPAY